MNPKYKIGDLFYTFEKGQIGEWKVCEVHIFETAIKYTLRYTGNTYTTFSIFEDVFETSETSFFKNPKAVIKNQISIVNEQYDGRIKELENELITLRQNKKETLESLEKVSIDDVEPYKN